MFFRIFSTPSVIFLTVVFLLASSSASARDFEKRFDGTINGGIFSVSNVLTSCDNAADARCAGAKDGTGTVHENGPFMMINIDVDADPTTFNSSTADLQLPTGTVVHAQLYWAGQYTDNGAPHKFFVPPDASKKNEVLFKVPGGSYATVAGTVDEDGTGFYQGYADVTSLINGSGTYGMANVQLTTGKQMFGGWTLVVVVESQALPLRRIVLWDGFLKQVNGSQKISLKNTLPSRQDRSSVAMNLIQYDGDKGNGDTMTIDGTLFVPPNPYPLTDPATADDIANSSITRFGLRFEDRNPFYQNTLGYDDDLFQILPLLDSNRHVELEFTTQRDVKHTGIVSIQSDIGSVSRLVKGRKSKKSQQ